MKKLIGNLLLSLTLACSLPSFASGGGDGGGGGGAFLAMEPIIVNVMLGTGVNYLNFLPQLKLADPADGDRLKAYMPIMRHLMIKNLIGRDPAQLQSVTFMTDFPHWAAEMLNKALGEEYVKEVLFDRWLIQ